MVFISKLKGIILLLIMVMATHQGCSKKIGSVVIRNSEMLDSVGVRATVISERVYSPCDDPLSYFPNTLYPYLSSKKEIRVIFHVMNDEAGDKNFSEERARKFFKNLLDGAQDHLNNNIPMNLPIGNSTPVYPVNIHYKKVIVPEDKDGDGILHHYDDKLYYFVNKGKNRNNYKREVINRYAVGGDSILNIFAMPHHPDSVSSPSYKVTNAGIALGNAIKIAGIYETGGEPWQFQSLLNHEVGHVLGLSHSWEKYDGCDDTPPHANCFGRSDDPPCDGVVSNNMMDYNNSQRALTPCQIGTIHRNLNREYSFQRKMVVKDWCKVDSSFIIKIDSMVEWHGSKDLKHSVLVKKGGTLTINCRISMPANAEIRVEPNGKLILDGAKLHNDCGEFWNGIIIEQSGKTSGEVLYNGNVMIDNVKDPID